MLFLGLIASINAQKNAFYYALPYNFFSVTYTINEKTDYQAPFVDYIDMIKGLKDPIIEESSTHYILSSLTLDLQSAIDTNAIFSIELTNPFFTTIANAGWLLDFGLEQTHNTSLTTHFEVENKKKNVFYMYPKEDMMIKYDTTYETIVKDSVKITRPKITSSWVKKSNRQMAEEIGNEIEKIRIDYYDLISGYHETDFKDLDLMLTELKNKENDLTVLFTGYSENQQITNVLNIYPQEQSDELIIPLFTISPTCGLNILEANDNICYELKMTRINKFTSENLYSKTKKAIYYRQAAYYKVALLKDKQVVDFLGIYPIAQFGQLKMLPRNVSSIVVNPYTGELKELQMNIK